jgi:hypothetical protein
MLARKDAFALVAKDPSLVDPAHRALRERVVDLYGGRIGLADVG